MQKTILKKLIILVCVLPFAAFAQIRVVSQKDEQPIMINSFSIKDRQQQSEVAGADKRKLFAVLMKWCKANFKDSIRVDTAGHTDTCRMSGQGMFTGSYTYHAAAPNRNIAPVNFEVVFKFEIKVTGSQYLIAITRLWPHIIDVTGPNEGFQNPKANATQSYAQPDFETDLTQLYATISEQADLDTNRLYRSAARYIAKAKNKKNGEL